MRSTPGRTRKRRLILYTTELKAPSSGRLYIQDVFGHVSNNVRKRKASSVILLCVFRAPEIYITDITKRQKYSQLKHRISIVWFREKYSVKLCKGFYSNYYSIGLSRNAVRSYNVKGKFWYIKWLVHGFGWQECCSHHFLVTTDLQKALDFCVSGLKREKNTSYTVIII